MSTLRYQSLNNLKKGLSISLQSYPFIQKFTLKCGEALPNQGSNPDKFYISGIYNDDLDYETSYITIKNSKFEYKIPYKGNFEFIKDTVKGYDQGYYDYIHLMDKSILLDELNFLRNIKNKMHKLLKIL